MWIYSDLEKLKKKANSGKNIHSSLIHNHLQLKTVSKHIKTKVLVTRLRSIDPVGQYRAINMNEVQLAIQNGMDGT